MATKSFKTKSAAVNFRDRMRKKGYAAFDYPNQTFNRKSLPRKQIGNTVWKVDYNK